MKLWLFLSAFPFKLASFSLEDIFVYKGPVTEPFEDEDDEEWVENDDEVVDVEAESFGLTDHGTV